MENIQMPSPKPNAVIVDIDETILDNSPYQIHIGHQKTTYDQDSWKNWTDKSSAKAMPGAIEFMKFAEQQKCEVFYITNRDVREQASTLRNLDSLGFPNVDADHLLLLDGASDKTERRAKVSATHRVALLIGDQLRDYDERFKDRTTNYGKDLVQAMNDSLRRYFILLPNPMYGTFRDAVQGKGTDDEKRNACKSVPRERLLNDARSGTTCCRGKCNDRWTTRCTHSLRSVGPAWDQS